jgi:hypothetical protein
VVRHHVEHGGRAVAALRGGREAGGEVAVRRRPEHDRHVPDQVKILDGDRHSGERSVRQLPFQTAGLLERARRGHGHEGAHVRVDALDPVQIVLSELDRRDLPGADGARLFESRKVVEFWHASAPWTSLEKKVISTRKSGVEHSELGHKTMDKAALGIDRTSGLR